VIPRFPTHYDHAKQNPLLQGCYDALRDLKAICDNPSEDYYQTGMIAAEDVWAALEPLRQLVFEVDGTNLAARMDKRTDEEMLAAVIAHDQKWRRELFGEVE